MRRLTDIIGNDLALQVLANFCKKTKQCVETRPCAGDPVLMGDPKVSSEFERPLEFAPWHLVSVQLDDGKEKSAFDRVLSAPFHLCLSVVLKGFEVIPGKSFRNQFEALKLISKVVSNRCKRRFNFFMYCC